MCDQSLLPSPFYFFTYRFFFWKSNQLAGGHLDPSVNIDAYQVLSFYRKSESGEYFKNIYLKNEYYYNNGLVNWCAVHGAASLRKWLRCEPAREVQRASRPLPFTGITLKENIFSSFFFT